MEPVGQWRADSSPAYVYVRALISLCPLCAHWFVSGIAAQASPRTRLDVVVVKEKNRRDVKQEIGGERKEKEGEGERDRDRDRAGDRDREIER